MRSAQKKSSHYQYSENGLSEIDIICQPRRVDRNVCVWTMMTSLYQSVGVVGTAEWACVLCGHCIQNEWVEQRIRIKFCVKLEHSPVETIRMIQKAFREDAVSAAQMKVWHRCFRCGRESVESDPCSGRPATSRIPENVERVRAAINKDQRLTVREADLGISKTSVSEILT